jgi:hypothetical protein
MIKNQNQNKGGHEQKAREGINARRQEKGARKRDAGARSKKS